MVWTWDPDTFGANWFNEGNDRMPAPLRYTSRFPTMEELEDHRRAVRAGYDADERRRIDLLMHTVARCDMRVEIIGSSVRHKNSDGRTQKQYRIVGARTPEYAAVLRQMGFPGEYGDITGHLVRPEQLPAALTAAIPACAPGKHRPDTFNHYDLKPQPGYMVDNSRNSPLERFQRLTRRPTDGGGQAILRLGNFHARPTRHQAMQWYDMSGDGRYLELRTPTHLDIRPAAPPLFTDVFTGWLDQARHYLLEREAERYR
ncbi:ESX secretion-associated protein EspG [Nocardia sp. NPDC048505]|uniref:ESX secretion-associated protein EspG n=1 Tax=unclassified Nocardia TaxID=2637762 RepID=UPI00341104C5